MMDRHKCEFCGKLGAKNIYHQKFACDKCMAEKTNHENPKEIKRFPGQKVDEYLRKHGRLPE